MKRTLFNAFRATAVAVAAAVMSFAVTGCGGENNKNESDAKELKVSVSNINLEAKAASETVDVTAKGVAWTATSKAAWVTVTPASGTGDASVVIAAEANPDQADRYTTVTFAADGVPSVNVTVFQNAAGEPEPEKPAEPELNQDKTMKYAEFGYYGDLLKTNGQCEIVGLTLVDKEVVDGSVELPFDNVSFALALPYKGSVEAISSSLFGTFNCVAVSAMKLPCVLNDASGYSYVYGQGDEDQYSYKVTSGTVTVTSTGNKNVKIDFDVKLEGGRTYKGTYSGAISLYDETQGGGNNDYETTTLTADYSLTMTKIVDARIFSDDDYSLFALEYDGINAAGNNDAIFMNILTNASATSDKNVAGTYTVVSMDASSIKAGDVIPGYFREKDGMTYFAGSWYLEESSDGQKQLNYAAIREGTITIAQNGNELTATIDFKDEAGHKITGKGTATASFSVNPTSVSALNASAYSVKIADFARPAIPVQKGRGILRSRLF